MNKHKQARDLPAANKSREPSVGLCLMVVEVCGFGAQSFNRPSRRPRSRRRAAKRGVETKWKDYIVFLRTGTRVPMCPMTGSTRRVTRYDKNGFFLARATGKTCRDCGKEIPGNRRVCDGCRKRRNRELSRIRMARRRKRRRSRG